MRIITYNCLDSELLFFSFLFLFFLRKKRKIREKGIFKLIVKKKKREREE